MSTDYDSPWKEALDAYFEPFLALLFPEVHARSTGRAATSRWTRSFSRWCARPRSAGATSISSSRSGRRTASSAGC